eukprot:TRINITY_DN25165_c0_g1_i1.p2 TRINITY_DN25165_c0_g1~~TRINITY_DN25165_c0_g1_i1.p2  ORF type:complete len:117 (-),score=15.06 TRINITY_DN25165_c0_g1_i1:77-427(-)
MIRQPPRSTHCISSAASDVYKRQEYMGLGNSIYLKRRTLVNEIDKVILLNIIARQSFTRTNPKYTFTIELQRTSNITGNTMRIGIIVSINGKRIAIIFIQAIVSSKPHIPYFILSN